jgi:hypothetical protein
MRGPANDTLPDDLWRNFPKSATPFEGRFATEDDCRAYWIEVRWGGEPACARCKSERVWSIRNGTTFECAECAGCGRTETRTIGRHVLSRHAEPVVVAAEIAAVQQSLANFIVGRPLATLQRRSPIRLTHCDL